MRSAMVALAFGIAAANSNARAEIKDYMILRLLYLDTSCGVDHLERLEPDADGNQRFSAKCRNVSSYPDGLEVLCTDADDDRSCRVTTPEKTYKHLELLQPR
ncbi:hypothetical protein [Hyphomicrobium sulfonivorans]|uniref:hypothetical protein n=2 Tax=Hyphomicrobium sulfonivorans TaxID=121290 RepID=UPI001AED291E|nr:hypothetical protein [Hyphomicrobium sulfonivorans]